MDREETTGQRAFARQTSERLSIGVAAGDRAAEVLAARSRWQQWEQAGRPRPRGEPDARPGPVRRALGSWLVAVGARLQGLPRPARRLGDPAGETVAP